MSFKSLKKTRSNLTDLANKLEKGGKKSYEKDERFWYPERDENGNGYAVIRFLPPAESDDVSYVQTFRHGFNGKHGWYIEECPTTIQKKCPVCEANSDLYDTLGKEKASRIVSGMNGRKRKMQYVSNIYIVKDPETPENEGKVFLFKYGFKIFEKIKVAVSPEFADETALDPFNLWEGANFTLKIRKVDGNVNYDSSSFGESAPMLKDDAKMEEVYNNAYNLSEIIADDKYKAYDDLQKRFNQVIGKEVETSTPSEPAPAVQAEEAEAPVGGLIDEEDKEAEDTLEYFKNM